MPSLREVQARFAAGVFAGTQDIEAFIKDEGLPADARFAIYRNNTYAGLSAAVRAEYPVVERLVGPDFFDAMVHAFVSAYPLRQGCLLDFGADLAEFIEGYESVAALPYLADVARLEWQVHEAFYAPDAEALRLNDLANLSGEAYADLKLHRHPSVRLLTSRWPVLRIYETNQPEFSGAVDIDLAAASGQVVLTVRRDFRIEIRLLTQPELILLTALAEQQPLEQALASTYRESPDTDPTAVLLNLLNQGVFTHAPS